MATEYKRHQSFPLRLAPSIRSQATELAQREGISLNHFISLALAEKISRMAHDHWTEGTTSVADRKPIPFRKATPN